MSGAELGWEDAAAGWERQRAFIARVGAPLNERLLGLLEPGPEETILELACGNGEVGLALAPLLEGGTLIQSDLEPAMVDAARREAARRGLTGIDHRVLDAESLDLPDESVDGIVCRFGYMLVDDPTVALAESRRVVRAGGRIALAVWGRSADNPWGTTVRQALLRLGLAEDVDPRDPGPFRLGEPGALEDVVAGAGLSLLTVESVAVTWRLSGVSAFWDLTLDLSTVTRGILAQLDDEVAAEVRGEVERELGRYVTAGELTIPGLAWVALAHR